jgi:inorganic pyrophosphatase/exopolyphosphatase
MSKIIITAGDTWIDIDAFACAIAYKKLYDLKGVESEVVIKGPLNESISPSLQNLHINYSTTYDENQDDEFVVVDVSDPSHISGFFKHEKIAKLFDHHWGFDDFWKSKIGDRAIIEPVGACATFIWEEFIKAGLESKIDYNSALLLYTAIISNTLNFKAQITTERDRKAASEIAKQVSIPINWKQKYFEETSASIIEDPRTAMSHDTKVIEIGQRGYCMVQIELWNSKQFVEDNRALIIEILKSLPAQYALFTSPSISEGVNYLVCEDEEFKSILSKNIGAKFNRSFGHTDKLWLRKEIIKTLLDSSL